MNIIIDIIMGGLMTISMTSFIVIIVKSFFTKKEHKEIKQNKFDRQNLNF